MSGTTPRIESQPFGAGNSNVVLADAEALAPVEGTAYGPDQTEAERLTLAELIEREASAYRDRRTTVGGFLARRLDDLAQLIRWTHSTTPDEHEARMEVWDAEIRERWRAIGYEEGRRAGCRCGDHSFA